MPINYAELADSGDKNKKKSENEDNKVKVLNKDHVEEIHNKIEWRILNEYNWEVLVNN